MTDELKRLRELAEAATPGPWSRTRDNGVHAGKPKRCIGSMYDSEYVVAAQPQTIIALLDERQRAVAELAEVRAENERLERARASWERDALVFAQNAEYAKERLAKACQLGRELMNYVPLPVDDFARKFDQLAIATKEGK